jgi:hypothetical protein
MTLQEYFEQSGTPAANSPVGVIMVKVLEKYSTLSFDQARTKANLLIQESAGRRRFVLPRVLSESELAEQKERLKTAWHKPTGVNPDVSSTTVAAKAA